MNALQGKKIALLGYGNQGRAQAMNLRDSGVQVEIGARPGKGWDAARQDGFSVSTFREAAERGQVLMFLLPDQVIPLVYQDLSDLFQNGQREVGFSHGYAYHFGGITKFPQAGYFLVGPKGAGAILREHYESGSGLPGVFAVESPREETRLIGLAYAKAVGVGTPTLLETTFQEETECDLFGEQVVLCGGILELMEAAFETLVKNGNSREMAFFECCFEAKMILDLWMKVGPAELSKKISPTAFYGGTTRGKRLIDAKVREKMDEVFQEIRRGDFSREWKSEADNNFPKLKQRSQELQGAGLEQTFQILKNQLQKSH
ncbi:MAG: ketol-acid reductoisomerase [Proteobacteria bacterium]|nr:ketol-acid reductoisomerase [Pseudomonadota bacterium]NDC25715.1 ketol-acid reductoisomerase [Pseudomonadota bacterium]NDD05542.1 ketol-acid reductoisomerase [Pseudomonadota bacterium]NDG26900.1 ketol-acid reductoisomerase [Pseudomonadota bacterium]